MQSKTFEMMKRLLFATSAAASISAGALAKEPPESPPPMIFVSPAGEPFRSTEDPYPSKTWFDGADANKDGFLIPSEWRADGDRFFATLDINADGELSPAEIVRYEEEVARDVYVNPFAGRVGGPPAGMKPPPGMRPPGGGPPGGGPPGGMPPGGMGGGPPGDMKPPKNMKEPPRGAAMFSIINVRQPILMADTNLDGRVTREEMSAALSRRFTTLDTDRAGKLAFDDLPQTPFQKMMKKFRR